MVCDLDECNENQYRKYFILKSIQFIREQEFKRVEKYFMREKEKILNFFVKNQYH